MGVRWFFSVFLWVPFCVCIIGIVSCQRGFTACDIPGCNCTIKTASWKIVNCSLRDEQIVNFEQNNIPESAIEIYIFGGGEINFATKTFNVLPGLTLIHINGTRKIAMERKSFNNLNSSSLFIQIHNCDELIIKTGAFDYIQSSISSEIVDVNYVTIEQSAFSKLYSSTFKNVKRVALYERSFDFKNQGNIMKHGPVSVISFDNVVVPEIPPETFLKSLASVMFYNSRIGSIHTDAFKANEISAVAMINTTIGDIRERAFTERTLINDFRISKCNISKLHPRSIMGAITKFTLNHSIITHIEQRAIVATVARAEVIGNQILNFRSSGFVFKNWNRIDLDDNIIVRLEADFVLATSPSMEIERFSFKGNEVYDIDEGALSFLSVLDERVLVFDDNFFNKSCNCSMDKWVEGLTNGSSHTIKLFVDTSYCKVNEYLSRCFSLPVGIINIHNFTQKTCQNFTVCEPYEGKTKIVNTTSKIFTQVDEAEKRNWLIFIMVVVGIFICAILTTFIVLLVRGSRWLKEKGYFRNNMHYNNNDLSNEEEGTIVTVDENEKLEIPEELTIEFLQMLAQRLDDPVTNQEATEMVVRLYEMFIVDDSYENNNRQDEEAHLYEELGNLNLQIPPPPYEEENEQQATNAPKNILKLMEEKFNLQMEEPSTLVNTSPALANEYSEPTDAAVHLYSELKNKTDKLDKNENKDTVKSNGSAKNIFRPLPSKPTSKSFLLDEAGPSSKL